MPKRKKTNKGKKYNGKLSLYPLDPKEALRIALNTPPPEPRTKKRRGKKKPR